MVKIISEIGINHNGSMDLAKKLIVMSAAAGCDYVKFQKRNPDKCVPEHQKNKMRDTPWGKIKYIDYKDTAFLEQFVNEQGKILPRRVTGTSVKYQRKVAQAVKRSRHLALMPYVVDLLK